MLFTKDKYKITFSIPGLDIDNKPWDKFSGGGRISETSNYSPGGMQPSIAVSGVTKRNQATIERAYDTTLVGLYKAIDGAVGEAFSVGVQPLKNRTTAQGQQLTFTGVIREVTPPDSDSMSSEVQMLAVALELNESMA